MHTLNVDAETSELADLLKSVEAGDEVLIAKAGRPVARLVPISPASRPPRRLGSLAGKFRVPDDFDTMLSNEIVDAFEGR